MAFPDRGQRRAEERPQTDPAAWCRILSANRYDAAPSARLAGRSIAVAMLGFQSFRHMPDGYWPRSRDQIFPDSLAFRWLVLAYRSETGLAWARSMKAQGNLTKTKGEGEMDIFVLFLQVFGFVPTGHSCPNCETWD